MTHPETAARTTENVSELRQRIIDAATVLFDTRGYAIASLEEVCSETGIDCDTLNSLFPTRYDLFRECVLGSARGLRAATETSADIPDDPRKARTQLNTMLESLATAHVSRRTQADFLRGDYRYLNEEDQRELREIQATVYQRIAALLHKMRPTLAEDDVELLAIAAARTMATTSQAPTVLSDPKLRTILTVSAMRLLESNTALTAPTGEFDEKRQPAWASDDSNAGRVIAATINLVYRNGFTSVTFDDIARETGFPAAAIQQNVRSTGDLLAAAFLHGANGMRDTMVGAAMSAGSLQRDILLAMSHGFVQHYFTDPKLMTVFILDGHHLPEEHAKQSAELHEEFMQSWLQHLRAIRPEISDAEARFIVYAALGIIEEVGRHANWEYDPVIMAKTERLVVATLIGER